MNLILNETFEEFAKLYYKELTNPDGSITYDFITSSDVYHLADLYRKKLNDNNSYFPFNDSIYLNQVLEKIQLINNENFKILMEKEKQDSRFSSIFKNQSSFMFVKDYTTQPEFNSLNRYLNLVKFKDNIKQRAITGMVFLFSEKEIYERFLLDEKEKLKKYFDDKVFMLFDDEKKFVKSGKIKDLDFDDFKQYEVLVETPNLYNFSKYTNQPLMAMNFLSDNHHNEIERLKFIVSENIDEIVNLYKKNIYITIPGKTILDCIKNSDFYDLITLNVKEQSSSILKDLFFKEDNRLYKNALTSEFVIEDVNEYLRDLGIPFQLNYKELIKSTPDVRINAKIRNKFIF